jgi:hypothetical protein
MANDSTCPAALRIATTHVGTGGNPKIGVPVGYMHPLSWSFPPPAPVPISFASAAVPNRPLSSPFSLAHSAKPTTLPYDDTSSSQALPALPSLKSEGQKSNLVQDSAALVSSLALSPTFLFPACIPLPSSAKSTIPSQVRPTCSPPFSSRFSRPFSFAILAPSSDENDFSPSSEDEKSPLDVVPSSLSLEPSPFASLDTPLPVSPVFRVTLGSLGRLVITPLPFSPPRSDSSAPPKHSTILSAVLNPTPIIADSGCTGVLVELVNFPALAPFFTPKPLPDVSFTLPDGSPLAVGGSSHLTGTLSFPHKLSPVDSYFLPASSLSQSLFGVSSLIRPHGQVLFTNTTCSFFDSPSPQVPLLTGTKAVGSNLWHLLVPTPPPPHLSHSALFSLQSLPSSRFWRIGIARSAPLPSARF